MTTPIINLDTAIKDLRHRRGGLTELRESVANRQIGFSVANNSHTKSASSEKYASRVKTHAPATLFTLGSMEEIDPKVTAKLVEDFQDISSTFTRKYRDVWVRMQGSVSQNVHIKDSDIDLVIGIDCTYDNLPESQLRLSINCNAAYEHILRTKEFAENELNLKYGKGTAKSAKKSIKFKNGSYGVDVDVVPAVRLHAPDKNHHGAVIADEEFKRIHFNHPWHFNELINRRDALTRSGFKNCVRLLKSIKAAINRHWTISSYDIVTLIWNLPAPSLILETGRELKLASNLEKELDGLLGSIRLRQLGYNTSDPRSTMQSPDGTKLLFHKQPEIESDIRFIHSALIELLDNVKNEQSVGLGNAFYYSLNRHDLLSRVTI